MTSLLCTDFPGIIPTQRYATVSLLLLRYQGAAMTHLGGTERPGQPRLVSQQVNASRSSGIQLVARPKHPKDESKQRQRIRKSGPPKSLSHGASGASEPPITLHYLVNVLTTPMTYRLAGGPFVARCHVHILLYIHIYLYFAPRRTIYTHSYLNGIKLHGSPRHPHAKSCAMGSLLPLRC